MLKKIIQFSIHNKLVIGLFTLALIAWGVYSLKQLPIDAVPDITNNQVQVITLSPSLASQEVERLISYPVEQTMATIPEIEQVRSISRFGLSVVTIVFTMMWIFIGPVSRSTRSWQKQKTIFRTV